MIRRARFFSGIFFSLFFSIFFCQAVFATAAVRQEIATPWTAATATTVSATFSSAALASDTIEVWIIWAGTTNPTVADSASQSYSFKTSVNDNNDSITIALFVFPNNSSATALAITATWGSAQGYRGMWIKEISGVTTSSYQTSGGQDSCPTGCTGTSTGSPGGISSGNVTPTAQPALISAVTWDDGGNAASTANNGTGGTNGWLLTGNTTYSGSSSSLRVTSTSAVAMTFTNATDGPTRHFITMASVYTEGGGAPANSNQPLMMRGVAKVIPFSKRPPLATVSHSQLKRAA